MSGAGARHAVLVQGMFFNGRASGRAWITFDQPQAPARARAHARARARMPVATGSRVARGVWRGGLWRGACGEGRVARGVARGVWRGAALHQTPPHSPSPEARRDETVEGRSTVLGPSRGETVEGLSKGYINS